MIITQIESAIIDRLTRGLGKLVREVHSYSGELDGEPAEVIRQLPGVWVTFGGIQGTELLSTTRNKWRDTGRFVVIAGARNVRSDESTRHGGRHSARSALINWFMPSAATGPPGLRVTD